MTTHARRDDVTHAQAAPMSNVQKDPEDWVSGDDPMTGAQASYLQTLCEEAGEEFEPNLSKADASKRIDALRDKTGKNAAAPAGQGAHD